MDVAPWCYKWIGLGRGWELWICPIKAIIHEKHSYKDNYDDIDDDDDNKDEKDFTGTMDLPNKSNYSSKRNTHIMTITLILMMMITRMRKILLCKSLDRTRLLGWQAIVEEFVQGYKL